MKQVRAISSDAQEVGGQGSEVGLVLRDGVSHPLCVVSEKKNLRGAGSQTLSELFMLPVSNSAFPDLGFVASRGVP